MSNPYTQPENAIMGKPDYRGVNYAQVRAIRDAACRTDGEDGFVLMTREQADALLADAGDAGPWPYVAEVEEITEDAMWDFMEQFLNRDVDPDDEETEEQVIRALEGPVLDAMVATAVKDKLSQSSYDGLIRPWRMHCEREGIELPT